MWHFTAGLFPRFVEPLSTVDAGVARATAGCWATRMCDTPHPPGSVTPAPHGYDLALPAAARVRLAR